MNRKIKRAQLSRLWFKASWYHSQHMIRLPKETRLYDAGIILQAGLLDTWLQQRNMRT
jgi:hypothetical protein